MMYNNLSSMCSGIWNSFMFMNIFNIRLKYFNGLRVLCSQFLKSAEIDCGNNILCSPLGTPICACRIVRKYVMKKDMVLSYEEFRNPSPPRLTGVVATNHAWSGKGAVCGCSVMCLIACCVILFALVAKCVLFVSPCRCSCAIIADDCKCADFASII